MPIVKNVPLLRQIRAAQPDWFCQGNKRFFNDVEYRAYYGKKTGDPFMVRSTYAWTDMLGSPKRLHWRINSVNKETLKIEHLIDGEFRDLDAVKDWLAEH